MPNRIIIRSNSTPGAAPAPATLQAGELALNTGDGALFCKLQDGSIYTIVPASGGAIVNQFMSASRITAGTFGAGAYSGMTSLSVTGTVSAATLSATTTVFNGQSYTWSASTPSSGFVLSTDGVGNVFWTAAAGLAGVSGTTNRIAKFASSNLIGDSIMSESGNAVTVGQLADSDTTLTIGAGGAAPTAVRTALAVLSAPSSGSFVGAALMQYRRAGTEQWNHGINNATSVGAKSANTDFAFWTSSTYVAAITTGGQFRTTGGFWMSAGNSLSSPGDIILSAVSGQVRVDAGGSARWSFTSAGALTTFTDPGGSDVLRVTGNATFSGGTDVSTTVTNGRGGTPSTSRYNAFDINVPSSAANPGIGAYRFYQNGTLVGGMTAFGGAADGAHTVYVANASTATNFKGSITLGHSTSIGNAANPTQGEGAFVTAFGVNHASAPGVLRLGAGNVAGGDIYFYTGNFVVRGRIQNNGDFALGASAPSARFHVQGTSGTTFRTDADTGVAHWQLAVNSYGQAGRVLADNTGAVTIDAATTLNLYTNGATRAIINSSGALVIGTDPTGSELLRVGGSFRTSSGWILSGSPGGLGASARYISGGGATDTFYQNVPTGGNHIWAINEVEVARITSTFLRFSAGSDASSSVSIGLGGAAPAASRTNTLDLNVPHSVSFPGGAIVQYRRNNTNVVQAGIFSSVTGSMLNNDDFSLSFAGQPSVFAVTSAGALRTAVGPTFGTANADANTTVTVGVGGAAPAAGRDVFLTLNSPSSATFLGRAGIIFQRNGSTNWQINTERAPSGAMVANTALGFYNSSAYVMSLESQGRLILGVDANAYIDVRNGTSKMRISTQSSTTMQLSSFNEAVTDSAGMWLTSSVFTFNYWNGTAYTTWATLNSGGLTVNNSQTLNAGSDATTSLAIGNGGGSPTATRSALLRLNAPSSVGFTGQSWIDFQRNSTSEWIFGVLAAANGAASATTDIVLRLSSDSLAKAALTTGGQFRTSGGFWTSAGTSAFISSDSANPAYFESAGGLTGAATGFRFNATNITAAGGMIIANFERAGSVQARIQRDGTYEAGLSSGNLLTPSGLQATSVTVAGGNGVSALSVYGDGAWTASYNRNSTAANTVTTRPLLYKHLALYAMADGGSSGSENYPAGIGLVTFSYTTRGSGIALTSTRASATQFNAGTFAAVQASDQLGAIYFGGDNSANLRTRGAAIVASATTNWTSTNSEGELTFFTTPNASNVESARWTVRSTGHFWPAGDNAYNVGDSTSRIASLFAVFAQIGTNPPGSGSLRVGGDASISSGTDATTFLTVGSGGASPAAVRGAILQLNAPHSGTFVGTSYVSFRRNGVEQWGVGMDASTADAKNANTNLFFYNGANYIAALTTGGQLRTSGGYWTNFGGTGYEVTGTTSANVSFKATVAAAAQGVPFQGIMPNGSVSITNVNGTASPELHIRPNAGQTGFLSFTEDTIADRWSIGIINGDSALYFRAGRTMSASAVAWLTQNSMTVTAGTDANTSLTVGTGGAASTARRAARLFLNAPTSGGNPGDAEVAYQRNSVTVWGVGLNQDGTSGAKLNGTDFSWITGGTYVAALTTGGQLRTVGGIHAIATGTGHQVILESTNTTQSPAVRFISTAGSRYIDQLSNTIRFLDSAGTGVRAQFLDNGTAIIGNDPGGSELLRVGGGARLNGALVVLNNGSFSTGTDSNSSISVGEGGAAPAANRAAFLRLNVPSSGTFIGDPYISLQRNSIEVWSFGLNSATSGGPKTANTDFYWWNGSAYVAALTTAGQLRTAGGFFARPTTSTNAVSLILENGSGEQFYVGRESSVAGANFPGSSAYSNVLYSNGTTRPFQFLFSSGANPLTVWANPAMTGGWNRSAVLTASSPTLVWASTIPTAKWGGIAFDSSAIGFAFYVNATSEDVGAGTLLMQVRNDGAVVVGTSPGGSDILRVGGSASFNAGLAVGGSARVALGADITTVQINGTATTATGGIRLRSTDNSLDMALYGSTGGLAVATVTNHPLLFQTNNTTRMTLNTSGALIIGTDPGGSQLLRVGGAGNFGGDLTAWNATFSTGTNSNTTLSVGTGGGAPTAGRNVRIRLDAPHSVGVPGGALVQWERNSSPLWYAGFNDAVNGAKTSIDDWGVVSTGMWLLALTTGGQLRVTGGVYTTNQLSVQGSFSASSAALINPTLTAISGSARGLYINPTLTAAANNDSLTGLQIQPTNTVGAFTGTNAYGLFINNITGAATNYAIYTNTGLVRLGDVTTIGTDPGGSEIFRVGGGARISGRLITTSSVEVRTTPAISANALTLDLSAANVFRVNRNANITTLTISNPVASGTSHSFTLIMDSTGTFTVTWPASVRWAGGTAPTLSGNGKTDIFTFVTTDGGTSWFGFAAGLNFTT